MRRILCLALLILVAPLPSAAEENVTRIYPLKNLEPVDAVFLVQSAYPNALDPGVEVRPERSPNGGYLRVVAPPRDQEAIMKILAEKDATPRPLTLQVTLLDALDAALPAPELPAGASGALEDVRALFPFKGYRVRHSAVVPANREAQVEMGEEFFVEAVTRPSLDASGRVAVPSFAVYSIEPDRSRSKLIVTSFAISRGETVVLGTSLTSAAKAGGDVPRALVVLVTALP